MLAYNTIIINQQWERGTDEGGIRINVHIVTVSNYTTLASVDPFEILIASDHQKGFQRSLELIRITDIPYTLWQQIPQLWSYV